MPSIWAAGSGSRFSCWPGAWGGAQACPGLAHRHEHAFTGLAEGPYRVIGCEVGRRAVRVQLLTAQGPREVEVPTDNVVDQRANVPLRAWGRLTQLLGPHARNHPTRNAVSAT